MAKTIRRRAKIRQYQKSQQRPERNEYRTFSGGIRHDVIGNTAELSELTDLAHMNKGLYGLFDDTGPHYSVVYGQIQTASQRRVIEPAFAYRDMIKLFQASTILRQCVDSYVTNIESYGYELEFVGPEGQEDSRAAKNERMRIERLLENLTSDGRPLQRHREDSRIDLEVLGARCFEVIEDAAGRVVSFDHVPTNTIRMTSKDTEATPVTMFDPKGGFRTIMRRFRRFIQVMDNGDQTWFKELGDPRPINAETGEVDYGLAIEDEATAIFYDGLYCPGTPCGMPRWAGAIPALLGSREAEMVNLNFFRDNAIPAMAILVSGGALTEESFNKIENYVAGVRGQASMNRIVVMEAVSEGAEAAAIDGSLPAPKIDIKPMLSERQHDGLFQDYVQEADRKARSSFRLPPIYIGSASEYNRASAFASVLTADQQIFVPERKKWDDMFAEIVLRSHNLKFFRVRSSGPGLQDPQEVARIVNSLGREGALTPNVSIKIANRYLDADIRPIMEEWGDLPFSVILQYVKNGSTIPGLDIFVEELENTVPEDPEDQDPPPETEEAALAKTLQRLIDRSLDPIVQQLDDTLQSIAAEA